MPVSIANTITGAELMFSENRLKPETDTCLNILGSYGAPEKPIFLCPASTQVTLEQYQ
jgi:hypothetical protein